MISELFSNLNPFKSKKDTPSPHFGHSEKMDKVSFILNEFDKAIEFENDNIERANEAWKLYGGFNNGQYPDAIISRMEAEGRNPFQGNFIRGKVDGLAGALVRNFFDIDLVPIDGNHSQLTRSVLGVMRTDKELLDWNSSYRSVVLDGLVHLGVEEIYIDYRYSPFGNVGFKHISPNHIILDPLWITNNTWDLKRAWKVAYLTPKEIKEIYNTKSEEIDLCIKLKEGSPSDFDRGDEDQGMRHYDFAEEYQEQKRVIEFHHIEKEKQKVEIAISDGSILPNGPDELKKEWAIVNNIDLNEGTIVREESVDVNYVTTICPSLSPYIVLEDKKSLIQIGRLPFFPWSAARINGVNSGIPELLKSVQQTYNYRESMLDYMIGTSAVGGIGLDPNVVDGDEYKMRLIESNWNKPGFRFWTSPGALSSGREFFKELPRNPVDYGVVNELTRMVEMADRLSKQPSAADARSEGSEETGILYARKLAQSEVATTLLYKSLEQHWNDKGEAYVFVAKKLYSGIYREFYGMDGTKIELNKPMVTPSGEVVENDISALSRLKIVVSQSPEGLTNRSVDRAINTELLRVLGSENPLARSLAVRNILKTLDSSKEDKAKYEESSVIEYELAKERAATELLNLKASQMQIQSSLMSSMQPKTPEANPNNTTQPPNAPGNPMGTIEGSTKEIALQS